MRGEYGHWLGKNVIFLLPWRLAQSILFCGAGFDIQKSVNELQRLFPVL
jgi:hypothetical protein